MADYSINAMNWTAEQYEAAATSCGRNAAMLAVLAKSYNNGEHPYLTARGDGLEHAAKMLAVEAASYAHRAERERARMTAVLEAQVSHGEGPALTDEELSAARAVLPLARAGVAHGGVCGHCGDRKPAGQSCDCFDNGCE